MLEKDSDHPDQTQGPQGEKQSMEELYSLPNWEERLDVARAQRERALARHLSAKKARKTSQVGDDDLRQEPGLHKADHTDASVLTAAASDVALTVPQTDASFATTDHVGRTLLVAMACFGSLGFGLALGAGALLGIAALRPSAPVEAAAQEAGPAAEDSAAMYADSAPVQVVALPAPALAPEPTPIAVTPVTPEDPVTPVALEPSADMVVKAKAPAFLVETLPTTRPPSPAEGVLSLVAWLPLQPVVATDPTGDAAALPVSPPDPLPGQDWTLADKLGATGRNPSALDLRVYAPDAVPEARLKSNLSRLARTGLDVENLQRVDFAVSTGHIRYYNPEDSTPAQALAEELGIAARDFSREQSGPVGLIEVWFAGVSKSNLAEELAGRRSGTYLFDRLRDKLRSD